jgi:predicted DNA-binding transcriptional regulator YafY
MAKNTTERKLARRLAIIALLPVFPTQAGCAIKGITAGFIFERLHPTFGATVRTYERDLAALADPEGEWRGFGLEVVHQTCAHDARCEEWFTTEGSKIPLFKSATSADALIASLARQELGPFLPASVRRSLDEQIATIEKKARYLHLTGEWREMTDYHSKVRRIPDGPPLEPSMVDPNHLAVVNEAVMKNLVLRIQYLAAKAEQPKQHALYPVGLVIHDRSLRLLAVEEKDVVTASPSKKVKSFHLHRMKDVTTAIPDIKSAVIPTLDQAIADGALDPWSTGRIDLHLRFADSEEARVFLRTLQEMKLDRDQQVFQNRRGQTELRASVVNTSRLRRMLQGMAREVKVLAPQDLKEDLQKFLAEGLAFQQCD